MSTTKDSDYMPCWKFENLEDQKAKRYCDYHSRLKSSGQLSICQPVTIKNLLKQYELQKQNRHQKQSNSDDRTTRNCA